MFLLGCLANQDWNFMCGRRNANIVENVHMLPVSLSDRRKSCLVWISVLNSQRGNILRLALFIMVEYANALNNPMINNEIFKNQNQNLPKTLIESRKKTIVWPRQAG